MAAWINLLSYMLSIVVPVAVEGSRIWVDPAQPMALNAHNSWDIIAERYTSKTKVTKGLKAFTSSRRQDSSNWSNPASQMGGSQSDEESQRLQPAPIADAGTGLVVGSAPSPMFSPGPAATEAAKKLKGAQGTVSQGGGPSQGAASSQGS